MASAEPPPLKSGAPLSPLNPCSRLSPSAPTIHTTGLEWPSVVVTIGEPRPFGSAHHAVVIEGFAPAVIFRTVRPDPLREGHCGPEPWNATNMPPAAG